MSIIIGSARSDEHGNITGGAAGDQKGGAEVSTQTYYNHSKGWRVFRAKDDNHALKIAEAMKKACANNDIGYDQNGRNTLYDNVKNFGFDPSKTTKKVETDCSALVRVCCAYAGIMLSDFNTSAEATRLMNSGKFEEVTGIKLPSGLVNGDILVTKTKGHTVIVVSGANAPKTHLVQSKKIVVVTGGSVNVRSGAGKDFNVLFIAHKGDELPYLSTAENGWYKIERNGVECYISNKYSELK